MSGGESIIFEGITYTANTTVNILINTLYIIEAVPSPGYILGGWGTTGGVSIEFLSGNTFTISMNFTGGSSITPQYEEIPTPTPTNTNTTTPTPTESETPTPTITPTNTETPTPTPTITPSQTPSSVTATTYVYNIATGCTCDSIILYSDSSSFDNAFNVYSDINLTIPYPNATIYHNGGEYFVISGIAYAGSTACPLGYCDTLCATYTNYDISNNDYNLLVVTITQNSCNEITFIVPPLTLIYVDSNTTPTTSSVINSPFTSIWSITSKASLPYSPTGTYSGIIDWGDGLISENSYANREHTYPSSGDYEIKIYGTIEGWDFGTYGGGVSSIKEITQWGILRGENNNNSSMFAGCNNLVLTGVTDTLNMNGITSVAAMFSNCTSLTTINNINSWDMSSVIDMSQMFAGCILFNDTIDAWYTNSVTNMSSMFAGASSFNQDLNYLWILLNVTNMSSMFSDATNFNGNISGWTTTNVTDMSAMFNNAVNFNIDISGWDTSSVVDMGNMFNGATSFNQPISSWDVSNVTNMYRMFTNCTLFDQLIGGWNVSNVTEMGAMLSNTGIFTLRYDNLLTEWSLLTLQNNVTFGVSGLTYSTGTTASTARQYIIDTYNWTFVGDTGV